jgi:nitroreductase
MKNEELIEQLNWRYAVKKFDATKKISDADWETLEDSLILSPSSYGLQPWKFYVVTDENVKKQLLPPGYNQPQITDSSHLVVIAAKKDLNENDVNEYIDAVIKVRETKREELEGFRQMMLGTVKKDEKDNSINDWSARQCYIALGFLLESAAVLEIDACPMEGFVPTEFDKILGIDKDGYFSVVLTTLGYRSEEDQMANLPKVRYEKSKLIKHI